MRLRFVMHITLYYIGCNIVRMDGDDSSKGHNILSDVVNTPQGTKGEIV